MKLFNVNMHIRDLELPLVQGKTLVYLIVIITPWKERKLQIMGAEGRREA